MKPAAPQWPLGTCGCESSHCHHVIYSVPAGDHVAMYVGNVCDACARTHMRPYLVEADR